MPRRRFALSVVLAAAGAVTRACREDALAPSTRRAGGWFERPVGACGATLQLVVAKGKKILCNLMIVIHQLSLNRGVRSNNGPLINGPESRVVVVRNEC